MTSKLQRGRVIVNYGDSLIIETESKQLMRCFYRRKLGAIACGDYVSYKSQGDETGVIENIQPRTSDLSRYNRYSKTKAVAANFNQIIVTLAVKPDSDSKLIDSYLAIGEQFNFNCILLLNKIDLLDSTTEKAFNRLTDIYTKIGYTLIQTSVKRQQGIDTLNDKLKNHTSILVGQSGVGKSSIIKLLLPDITIQIGSLSELNELGNHTTTTTTLYHLNNGGELIDSPGVREFIPSHQSMESIQTGFREFNDYYGHCKFNDCMHITEPQCAIIEAVKNNQISQSRWENYKLMITSLND